MTNPIKQKRTDSLGRVQFSKEERNELLDEFESSALSGIQFAKSYGIKHSTFAGWLRNRKRESLLSKEDPDSFDRDEHSKILDSLVEVSYSPEQARDSKLNHILVSLPCGVSLRLCTEEQIPLVSKLAQTLSSHV